MLLNSIKRWSLRRSSFGLHRRPYIFPSDPRIFILRGFCRELRTKASSNIASLQMLASVYFGVGVGNIIGDPTLNCYGIGWKSTERLEEMRLVTRRQRWSQCSL